MDFPRYGRHADELCVTELASVVWAVQMSTVEFHPWGSRRADTERPDEWRIDLDPMPRCEFATVRRVARVVHEILDELGMAGWPKTSGGNGLHVYVRIEPRWAWPRRVGRQASPAVQDAAVPVGQHRVEVAGAARLQLAAVGADVGDAAVLASRGVLALFLLALAGHAGLLALGDEVPVVARDRAGMQAHDAPASGSRSSLRS